MLKTASSILWPSFLAACIGEMLFFAMIDPNDLLSLWRTSAPSRTGVYSLGFFFFWFLAAMASGMTWLLARSAEEVNR